MLPVSAFAFPSMVVLPMTIGLLSLPLVASSSASWLRWFYVQTVASVCLAVFQGLTKVSSCSGHAALWPTTVTAKREREERGKH